MVVCVHKMLRISAMVAPLAAIAFAPCALLAQETTTVGDTLHDPSGLPLSGHLVVTNQTAFVSADGFQIPAGNQITVNVTNGSFSVQLVPNVGASPSGTSYSVSYYLPNRRTTETWIVPQTPNPANLANVRVLAPPVPSTQLAITQVNPPSPCTPSSFLAWRGAGWNCAQPDLSLLSGVASPSQLPPATTTAPGIVQLTGDLGSSATSPQVTATHLAAALPVSQGGTGASTPFSPGAVVFASDGGAYTQDAQFSWDASNHRLGIGTTAPVSILSLNTSSGSAVETLNAAAGGVDGLSYRIAGGEKYHFGYNDAAAPYYFIWDAVANADVLRSYLNGNLTIGAPAGSVSILARGTDQGITLTPSGSGATTINGPTTINGGARVNTTTMQPACDATERGTFWVVQGAPGVKDSVQVCAKDAADAYAWRTIY